MTKQKKSPEGLSNPEIEPRSPALQADSLPAEPPGKPRNTGMGSLSLLQQIFLTQDSNRSLLHCRQLLYQLSYQGSHTICHVIDLDLFIITVRYFANFNCIRCLSESEATQLCLTLCNSMDCSLLSSSVHGIFQERILVWVAISFSKELSQPRDQTRVCIAGRLLNV